MKHKVSFELEFKRHNFPGKFIVFEGNEASGKTTHAKDLVETLEKQGLAVWSTKEPTESEIGKMIRRILSGDFIANPTALQYLFSADRALHQDEIIKHLKAGEIVVSDRYFWSAVAYGIADLKNTPDFYLAAYSILSFYNQYLAPDLTFYLEVDLDVAIERIKKSHKHSEIYDNRQNMEKIKSGYDKLIKKFPEEFTIIDANPAIKNVSETLLTKVWSTLA